MPGCCVPDCANRTDKGFRLFRLPQIESRRNAWIELVGRTNLPSHSHVCEVHFDEQQFEQNRADKRKLLRRDAIPSLLKKQKEIPAKRHKIDPHLLVDEKDAYVDIPQSPPVKVEISQSESDSDVDVNLCNLTDKEIIDKLKRQLKAEQQRNRNLKKQLDRKNLTYNKLFAEDQLRFLEIGTREGFTWSDKTIYKAAKLYLTCGTKGYEEIRKQNLPYPSVRTVQERVEGFKFQPGVLQDICYWGIR